MYKYLLFKSQTRVLWFNSLALQFVFGIELIYIFFDDELQPIMAKFDPDILHLDREKQG